MMNNSKVECCSNAKRESNNYRKRRRWGETNLQCQKDTLLRTKGNDLNQETATSLNVAEIKVSVRWKLNKVPPGSKQALIVMYLELPNPPEIIPWSYEK